MMSVTITARIRRVRGRANQATGVEGGWCAERLIGSDHSRRWMDWQFYAWGKLTLGRGSRSFQEVVKIETTEDKKRNRMESKPGQEDYGIRRRACYNFANLCYRSTPLMSVHP